MSQATTVVRAKIKAAGEPTAAALVLAKLVAKLLRYFYAGWPYAMG